MSYQTRQPFAQFFDLKGKPLEGGFIYFGEANKNPQTDPIQVYSDDALTQPLAQPLRTSGGYVSLNGKPIQVFASDISMSVACYGKDLDLVFYLPEAFGGESLLQFIADLANNSDPAKGAALVGYSGPSAPRFARTTIADAVSDAILIGRQFVSAEYYGVVADSTDGTDGTDNTAALQLAIDANKGPVLLPAGRIRVSGQLSYNGCGLIGQGRGKTILHLNHIGAGYALNKTASGDLGPIERIGFIGNGSNWGYGTSSGSVGWARARISDCYFRDFAKPFDPARCVFLTVQNVEFEGPVTFSGDYNNNVTFVGCYFLDSAAGYGADFNCINVFQNNTASFIECAFNDNLNGLRVKNARATLIQCTWERSGVADIVGERAVITIDGGTMLGKPVATARNVILSDASRVSVLANPTRIDNFTGFSDVSASSSIVLLRSILPGNTIDGTSKVISVEDNLPSDGTFTPTVIGSTSAGTATYSTRIGRYSKIGSRVFYNVVVEWSGHTGTGSLRITGQPFTANATASNHHGAVSAAENLTFSGQLSARMIAGGTTLRLAQTTSGAAITEPAIDADAKLEICGWYEA